MGIHLLKINDREAVNREGFCCCLLYIILYNHLHRKRIYI